MTFDPIRFTFTPECTLWLALEVLPNSYLTSRLKSSRNRLLRKFTCTIESLCKTCGHWIKILLNLIWSRFYSCIKNYQIFLKVLLHPETKYFVNHRTSLFPTQIDRKWYKILWMSILYRWMSCYTVIFIISVRL